MSHRALISIAFAVAAGGAGGAALVGPTSASAYDEYPCGKEVTVTWTAEPVQLCPLTGPLPPDDLYPVYTEPVPNASGSSAPEPAGWLDDNNEYFVCDRAFPDAEFSNPNHPYRNYWWAYTRADNGVWGWMPESFFRGGVPNEPDRTLRVCPDPEPAPECDPSPRAANMKLVARIRRPGKDARESTTVGYGRRLVARGRLTTGGEPVAGASLCVAAKPDAIKARRTQRGSVTTGKRGRFSYRLGPGPSRRVWFIERTGDAAAADSIRVNVRAPVALQASPRSLRNGQTVALRGQVGGRPRTAGALVEMQALRAGKWQTFGTTRTRRKGRFDYSYRFRHTTGEVVYQLRARVPAQRGHPFAPGVSKPVRVRVRGR